METKQIEDLASLGIALSAQTANWSKIAFALNEAQRNERMAKGGRDGYVSQPERLASAVFTATRALRLQREIDTLAQKSLGYSNAPAKALNNV